MIYQRKSTEKKKLKVFPAIILNVELIPTINIILSVEFCIALPWKPLSILHLSAQFGIFHVSLPAGKSSV